VSVEFSLRTAGEWFFEKSRRLLVHLYYPYWAATVQSLWEWIYYRYWSDWDWN
jgi:hypothetical protein